MAEVVVEAQAELVVAEVVAEAQAELVVAEAAVAVPEALGPRSVQGTRRRRSSRR